MSIVVARLVVALAGVSLVIGCASSAPPPAVTDGGFSGPSVQVNSQERHHVIVVEAPSPGWEATLTRVLPGPGHREAYLTLRRPFPGALYPQVIVTQRVLTGVPTKEALRVYARIVDHDAPARSDEPFAQAAEARGATP